MLGNYFYHQIVRKTVIAFGTLFNDIHVQHDDGAGNVISDIKVPIAYGPRQKFLARITQQAELNKATQIHYQECHLKLLIYPTTLQERQVSHKHLKRKTLIMIK